MIQLSWLDYPVPTVLCWLPCHNYPFLVVLFQACPCCHVQAILFSLSCPDKHLTFLVNLYKLTVLVLSKLSSLGCHVLDPVHGCPIKVVLYQLSSPSQTYKWVIRVTFVVRLLRTLLFLWIFLRFSQNLAKQKFSKNNFFFIILHFRRN